MAKEDKRTLTPRLRFPAFQDAPGWDGRTLANLAEPVTRKAETGDGSKILTLSGDQGIVLQSEYFGKQVAGKKSERYIKIDRDDFVYNDRTTKQATYGTIKRLSAHEVGIVSPIYKCFRFGPTESPTFWDFYFESGVHDAELRQLVNEGARAGRFNISIDRFLTTTGWRPEEAEQSKIADCLTSLDEMTTAQVRKVEALGAHKKGLMQQLFPCEGETLPRLRFPEFRGSPEWADQYLGPMTNKVGSGVTPLGGDKNYKTAGRPFIRSQNVGWGELLLDDVAFIDEETHSSFDATEIVEADVLLNITGASIGRSAIVDSRIVGGNVNQHVCIIRVKQNELNPVLLNQFLISVRGQKQIDSFQAGGNRQGLNFGQIKSFAIPVPPTQEEQRRISDYLSTLDALIVAEAEKLATLKTHKQSLMQQLFPSPEGE